MSICQVTGQLVQSGFSFFWDPNHEPTLVPPTIGFNVNCDFSKCVVADRVEHCVPTFKEDDSFVHGVPATASPAFDGERVSRVEDTEPASEAVGSSISVIEVAGGDFVVDLIEPISHDREAPDFAVETPEGLKDFEVHTPLELMPDFSADVPSKGASDPRDPKDLSPGDPPDMHASRGTGHVPFDHLLCHQPASRHCDVCRQAKLRQRPHKRFHNQSESSRAAQVIEAPTEFLQRISIDHMESTEEGLRGEQYALICVDQFSWVLYAYPSKSKSQAAVGSALRHFCRGKRPVVALDRYPSLLVAICDLHMVSDPAAPNSPIHNALVESSINVIRQGTRSLLVQSGLNIMHWLCAMSRFSYQYDLSSPPTLADGSLRAAAYQHQLELPERVEGPALPPIEFDSKLHMALTYQPEPRMLPFGAMVWLLGKSKDPTNPKSL